MLGITGIKKWRGHPNSVRFYCIHDRCTRVRPFESPHIDDFDRKYFIADGLQRIMDHIYVVHLNQHFHCISCDTFWDSSKLLIEHFSSYHRIKVTIPQSGEILLPYPYPSDETKQSAHIFFGEYIQERTLPICFRSQGDPIIKPTPADPTHLKYQPGTILRSPTSGKVAYGWPKETMPDLQKNVYVKPSSSDKDSTEATPKINQSEPTPLAGSSQTLPPMPVLEHNVSAPSKSETVRYVGGHRCPNAPESQMDKFFKERQRKAEYAGQKQGGSTKNK